MATVEELQAQINALKTQLNSLLEELVKLDKDKNSKKETSDLEKHLGDSDKVELRIVPDSSWLIAILDEKDTHHIPASSSLGAILPYKPIFYIPALVYLETISRLIRVNKIQVKKCEHKIDNLLQKINYKHSSSLAISEILRKYNTFSRVKISKLHPLDFYIATEGVFLDAKILTCDVRMYYYVNKYYPKIYFLTDKVKKKGNDLSKLIKDIQIVKNSPDRDASVGEPKTV